MKGLTEKQLAILTFIESFSDKNGYSPSYREIMSHFSLSSPGSVYKFVKILKRKNVLTAEKGCGRSMKTEIDRGTPVKETVSSDIELPFIGHIEAGCPIETFPLNQSVTVPKFLVQNPQATYILRIKGNSFKEEHLEDGDFILVEARSEAEPGETILAMISQHDTIIARYFPTGQYARLEGKNPQHQPLVLHHDNIKIQGVLVGLLRAY